MRSRGGIHGDAERIDEIEARLTKGADVVAEQGEDERFLRLQDLEAGNWDPHDAGEDECGNECRHPGVVSDRFHTADHIKQDVECNQRNDADQDGHAIFLCR